MNRCAPISMWHIRITSHQWVNVLHINACCLCLRVCAWSLLVRQLYLGWDLISWLCLILPDIQDIQNIQALYSCVLRNRCLSLALSVYIYIVSLLDFIIIYITYTDIQKLPVETRNIMSCIALRPIIGLCTHDIPACLATIYRARLTQMRQWVSNYISRCTLI